MNAAEIIRAATATAAARQLLLPTDRGGLGINADELNKMFREHIDAATSEITLAHEWDFIMRETTTTTTADEANYILPGANNDCFQVATVKYDSDEILLKKRTWEWMDDYLQRSSVTTPCYWLLDQRTTPSPRIKIVAAPSESNKQLKYRYWPTGVSLAQYPDEFEGVFVSCLLKRVVPDYRSTFEGDLRRIIMGYDRPAGEVRPTVLDEKIRAGHQRRAGLQGWSGT